MVCLGLSCLTQRNRRGQLERGGGVFFSAGNECLSAASFISKAKNTPPPRSIPHNQQSGSPNPPQTQWRECHTSGRGTKNANTRPNTRAATPIPKADRKSTRLNSSHVRISYAV